jgi:hypothetical protein
MNARVVGRIETGVERVASALFAGAVAFASYTVLRNVLGQPQLGIIAAVAAGVAFLLSSLVIRGAPARKPSFRAATFDLPEFQPFETDELVLSHEERIASDELVLTAADRLDPAPLANQSEPLLLDDVLAEIGPDSRVVRLFDRKAMPTPGQLQSRIEDHLHHRGSISAPDASQALSEALAELRRSLR